jgi:hypothetical protein
VKPFLKLTALALGLAALCCLAGDPAAAAQAGRKLPQPIRSKVQRVHGHRVMHPKKMASLKNGKHHVHTGRAGHRVHTSLKNGKLQNLHVTDKKGRSVAVHKKFVRKGRRKASLSPLDNDLIAQELARGDLAGEEFSAAQVGVSVQVFVVFSFQVNGQMVLIYFPSSSVVGGTSIPSPSTLPVDPNIPEPDGGDDLSC